MKLLLLTLLFVGSSFYAFANDKEVIARQFVEYFAQSKNSGADAMRHLAGLDANGQWVDIDYASQRRGTWPTRAHLDRLISMASAYINVAPSSHESVILREGVLRGLSHWIEQDYRNPNWYNARIGVPHRMGIVMMLLGDAVPAEMRDAARPIFYRSELGMTGQNKVWCAGIGIMKGVLYDDLPLLEQAVAEVWSELKVTTDEGIQPDWSFHQHGPQQQFGNYGNSFGTDMVQWASVLRDTRYALSGDALSVLRNYLLEGPSWLLWNGRLDISGCGRQIGEGSQRGKALEIRRQLAAMQEIDPDFRKAYRNRISLVPLGLSKSPARRNRLTGFRAFWRSEMGVQRRPTWYASIKMSSSRVIGTETNNSENMQGLHLGDGVLLMQTKGDEYEGIVPVWDWKRLPGTTCDQGLVDLVPGANGGFGGSDFAGVLGADESGIAAMIYQRGNLVARKSWFFLKDQIVCLGAGISGETEGAVYTSVAQRWQNGPVDQGDAWVWHDGIAYQFIEGQPQVAAESVEGNWNLSFPARGDRPVLGDVFSIWIDHGESPEGVSYAYRIFPRAKSKKIAAKNFEDETLVLKNTPEAQAIESAGSVYAAFYEAGTLNAGDLGNIEVGGPCLLYINGSTLRIADPTHSQQSIEIKLNGTARTVELPQEGETGKTVFVEW